MSEAGEARAIRAATEGTDWVARAGSISRRSEAAVFHVYEFAGWYRFLAKPLVWDEIFWRIMRFEFKRRPSPSRHFWGHNCPVKFIYAERISSGSVQDRAAQALAFGDGSIARLAGLDLSLARLDAMAIEKNRPDDLVETEVVELFATGKLNRARGVCRDVLSGTRRVSHVHHTQVEGRSVSFFELAAKWTPVAA